MDDALVQLGRSPGQGKEKEALNEVKCKYDYCVKTVSKINPI